MLPSRSLKPTPGSCSTRKIAGSSSSSACFSALQPNAHC
ncbi:hypothetical protein BVRB_2g039150 [Beta vulgaris subsp. vulgaris]|nr:hypothetical protein BVRB_2g039150 [Beta vulgaris subsp. vulgaris]